MPESDSHPATMDIYQQPLDDLLDRFAHQARKVSGRNDNPRIVVSPYRFNPLGAHIDHQGGSVLARCLDQYTLLYFWPRPDGLCSIHCNLDDSVWQCATFKAGQLEDDYGWDSMARASVTAFSADHAATCGYDAVVFGTLISGGLSSSASVILAYLTALADVNEVKLSASQLVELVRRVENNYRGLNNGLQDQMSIVYGKKNHLALLDCANATAATIADPHTIAEVAFLMCYSGVSRNLVTGSNFNARVAECREAARLLSADAQHLGEVPEADRTESTLIGLPEIPRRRATHVFSEMQRVEQGCVAWERGNWHDFGQLMNQSCQSSINNYESGSPWLIDLHEMASVISGVHGCRFSGGGFGGCLFMLVDTPKIEAIAEQLMNNYLARYPEMSTLARMHVAQPESTVRIVST